MTPGNPLAALVHRPVETRVGAGQPIDYLGNWPVYEVRRGGMGEVFICGREGVLIAAKAFQPRLFFDAESRHAFLREVMIWLRLTGTPFVMPALGLMEAGNRIFVVMPAIEPDQRGVRSVADLINQRLATPVEVFSVVWQIALGMKLAQDAIQNVAHGDLKPANVLLNQSVVLIADFGLASLGEEETLHARATQGYESPEYPEEGATPAGDVFSFGVLARELLESSSSGSRHSYLDAIGQIATACTAPNPSDRPTFSHIVSQLGDLVLHNRASLGPVFASFAIIHSAFRELGTELASEIARGLLLVGAPDHALRLLEAKEDASTDPRAMVQRGTALSLLNRDQDALEWFERALPHITSNDERFHLQSEYALSLKRLMRYEEAENLLRALLVNSDADGLTQIVVNLAGLLTETERPQAAVNLISKNLRDAKEHPYIFAARGQAHQALGNYQEAADDFQRAIALDPKLVNILVELAEIFLEHLQQWEDSYAALHAAHQQGFFSPKWLVLTLAAAIVTNRAEDAEALIAGLDRDVPEPQLKDIQSRAVEIALKVIRSSINPAAIDHEPTDPAMGAKTVKLGQPGHGTRAAPETSPRTPQPTTTPGAEATSAHTAAFEPAGIPFFNVRFYVPENRYSVDYYGMLDSPEFVDEFLQSWNLFKRDHAISNNAEARETPFYFSQCPNCSVVMLTNRDAGSVMACRQCDTKATTRSIETDRTRELIQLIEARLGKTRESHENSILYLLFQPSDDDPERLLEMQQLCSEHGFDRVADNRPGLSRIMRTLGARSGSSFNPLRESILVRKMSNSSAAVYSGETPAETDRLVRALRKITSLTSVSIDIDPQSKDAVSLLLQDKLEELEQLCRSNVSAHPQNLVHSRILAEVLRGQKKHTEAKGIALTMIAVDAEDPDGWIALGEAECDLGEHDKAIEALEHAVVLDPTRLDALLQLRLCFKLIGDEVMADGLRSRIQALGGAPH
jgi:tetratricopeptide (TPR) repeat protein